MGATLSNSDFTDLCEFIYNQCGIKLSPAKKTMLESRLQKRLVCLEIDSFADYCRYLFSERGIKQELTDMIDVVTTNKTDFFREPAHFRFLEHEAIPALIKQSYSPCIKVWSSACSTGQEAYTVAMLMMEMSESLSFDFGVLGTDISTRVLAQALNATYPAHEVEPIPMHFRKKYLLKSKERANPAIRISSTIRAKVDFERANLIAPVINVAHDFDIIFCRNVLIYFDKQTQARVVRNLVKHLKYGGYLFIGHSESIYHIDVPLEQVQPTIYQKVNDGIVS